MNAIVIENENPVQNLHEPGQPMGEALRHHNEPADFNPITAVFRLMRGRWIALFGLVAILASSLGYVGFFTGKAIYESQAIIRISAREPGILFASSDDSKLKLFQSFVKGETTYVASHAVMLRAVELIKASGSEYGTNLTAVKLSDSITITRKEALIIVKSTSLDAAFAAQKANAVVDAYIALHSETKTNLANFRKGELGSREQDLLTKLENLKISILDVSGEYGMPSLIKSHNEKVSQIGALISRQGEVAATLAAMKPDTGSGSADVAEQEIIRATLLDRALADLNFDKAKREAEFSAVKRRYSPSSPKVAEKINQIEIIDKAMANRRQQIKVLGQTGALTDADGATKEESIVEIQALYDKVTKNLVKARADSRALNAKRVELNFLEEERDETRKKLDGTRQALDIIQVESRNSMPGLIDVMSRAYVSEKPSKDSSLLFAAGGVIGGGMLASLLVFGCAITSKRIRFTDDLWRHIWCVPVLNTIPAGSEKTPENFNEDINRARNNILLFPSRAAPQSKQAKIIAVSRFDRANNRMTARALADSFAEANLKTLFVDADLQAESQTDTTNGWRELITGEAADITSQSGNAADSISCGNLARIYDASVSVSAVRQALARYSNDYDVIVVSAGDLGRSLSAELVLSASDLGVGIIQAGDNSARVNALIAKLDSLPRNGGGVIFTGALNSDPALVAMG